MNFAEIERLEANYKSVKEKNSERNSEAIALGGIKLDDEESEICEFILLEKARKLSEITSSCEPTFSFLAVFPLLEKIVRN